MSDFQTYADSDQMIRAGYSTPLRSCAYQGMLPSMITVTNKRCKLEMTCQSDTPHLKVSSAGVCERNVGGSLSLPPSWLSVGTDVEFSKTSEAANLRIRKGLNITLDQLSLVTGRDITYEFGTMACSDCPTTFKFRFKENKQDEDVASVGLGKSGWGGLSQEEIIASAGFSVAQSRESGSNKDTMKQEEVPFHDLLRPIADYIFQQSSSRRADLAIIHDNDWIQICERVVPEQLSQFSQIYLPLFKSWIKNQEPT
ncbi:hypothetical protein C8Q75DRAFT_733316 [Abortiporus biennis]|nr:hypothetical protein C8Q75DRAFT_733316 [Abortiporus biennis]